MVAFRPGVEHSTPGQTKTMKTHQTLIGQSFNRLTVESESGKHPTRRDYLWLCRCSCGGTKIASGATLKEGKVQSCGCLNNENRAALMRKVGAARKGKITRDLTGQKMGRLTCESHFFKNGVVYWNCVCECGNRTVARTGELTRGATKSCGCYNRELKSQECRIRNTTHGMANAPEYNSWISMMGRCFNPKATNYETYGGAGRTVCEFIRNSPLNMVLLIGRRPTPLHTVDRIDNKLVYSCGSCAECLQKSWPMNVRWATWTQQHRNRDNNRFFKIGDETRCAAEWAEKMGMTWAKFVCAYRDSEVQNATT